MEMVLVSHQYSCRMTLVLEKLQAFTYKFPSFAQQAQKILLLLTKHTDNKVRENYWKVNYRKTTTCRGIA